MTATVDARFESLGLLGYEGAANDRVAAWLRSQLPDGTTGTIGDLWDALFDQSGVAPGARPDRLFAWIRGQGYAGDSLPDLNHEFWNDLLIRTTLADSNL